jgi:hypothetical protein
MPGLKSNQEAQRNCSRHRRSLGSTVQGSCAWQPPVGRCCTDCIGLGGLCLWKCRDQCSAVQCSAVQGGTDGSTGSALTADAHSRALYCM